MESRLIVARDQALGGEEVVMATESIREPCGKVAILYLDCGFSYTKLHMG